MSAEQVERPGLVTDEGVNEGGTPSDHVDPASGEPGDRKPQASAGAHPQPGASAVAPTGEEAANSGLLDQSDDERPPEAGQELSVGEG